MVAILDVKDCEVRKSWLNLPGGTSRYYASGGHRNHSLLHLMHRQVIALDAAMFHGPPFLHSVVPYKNDGLLLETLS